MLQQRFLRSLMATSFSLLLLATPPLAAQALGPRHYGPIIEGYGGVFDVPSVDFITPTTQDYRAVFDVSLGADQPDQVNRRIETLARFLNMHGQAGVPIENMHLALVLHGTAGKDALSNAAYRERFGVANPNLPLLEALSEVGVQVYLCGQTAMSRGLPKEQLSEPVQLALSAMTMLATLQADGYSLISF